jgi:hypothetical protein
MVRTTLGAEVETNVTVSGSESVEFLEIKRTSDVLTGDREATAVRPPAGSLYELIAASLLVDDPGGNSTDTHRLDVQSESETIPILNIISSGDKQIELINNTVTDGDVNQNPGTDAAQVLTLKGARASNENGYQFRYINKSGATQTGRRRYRLWLREIEVGG